MLEPNSLEKAITIARGAKSHVEVIKRNLLGPSKKVYATDEISLIQLIWISTTELRLGY